MEKILNPISFDTGLDGSALLIFGAIHGIEICGPLAIKRWIEKIEQGTVLLTSGKVTFVPVCNPKAYKAKLRFVDHNLNRIFGSKQSASNSYEYDVLPELEELILEHDALLDIHSMTSASDNFAFNDDIANQDEIALCRALGFDYIVGGWPNLYAGVSGGTTCEFACQNQKTAVTVECYSHDDVRAIPQAFDAIGRFLYFFGVIECFETKNNVSDSNYVLMDYIVRKEKEGSFVQARSNGDVVKKDQLLAIYDDGEKVFSKVDGIIIMPSESVGIGEEWMYLGKKR